MTCNVPSRLQVLKTTQTELKLTEAKQNLMYV